MPQFPFDPPALSTIRERALQSVLDQRAKAQKGLAALQEFGTRGRSPGELEIVRAREAYYRSVLTQSEDLLAEVRTQRTRYAEEPLRPNRRPVVRSDRDRMVAILGHLERERKHNVSFTRGASDRAKALAASRSRFSSRPSLSDSFGIKALRRLQTGAGSFFQAGRMQDFLFDPCVEYKAAQQTRRRVIFAKGHNRGYRVPHHGSPC